MILEQVEQTLAVNMTAERIIEAVVIAFFVGLITWAFARRKNNSESFKNETEGTVNETEATLNESAIIQNYIKTVADLQAQIDSWLDKIKTLRVNAATVEDLNTELKKTIIEMKAEEERAIAELKLAFQHEREKLIHSLTKMINLVQTIVDKVAVDPTYPQLRMETVRILEMLFQLRENLENSRQE